MEVVLIVPTEDLRLERIPASRNPTLRAWDAADDYLLAHLAQEGLVSPSSRVLVVNDAFGALACGLQACEVSSWSDSATSHRAALHNAALHGLRPPALLPSTQEPSPETDLVVLKVPRSQALLEDQLRRLRRALRPGTPLVAGGMLKALYSSTQGLFEAHFGPTTTSLARKKARLLFCAVEPSLPETPSPFPSRYLCEELGETLVNEANVFSRQQLDLGTRVMLSAFEFLPASREVMDLGCGNGVLGLAAKKAMPGCRLTMLDHSYMAVASARQNHEALFGDQEAAYVVADTIPEESRGRFDLILCNPPFHQGRVMGDEVAWQMFVQGWRALAPDGQLWVVGNRHLGYHAALAKIFGRKAQVIAGDARFVVLVAQK